MTKEQKTEIKRILNEVWETEQTTGFGYKEDAVDAVWSILSNKIRFHRRNIEDKEITCEPINNKNHLKQIVKRLLDENCPINTSHWFRENNWFRVIGKKEMPPVITAKNNQVIIYFDELIKFKKESNRKSKLSKGKWLFRRK